MLRFEIIINSDIIIANLNVTFVSLKTGIHIPSSVHRMILSQKCVESTAFLC